MSKGHASPVKVIYLLGPTASGKSSLSLWLAQQMKNTRPVEIISVDSALVYRGMDIGTAKPDAAELAQVPHHLINIIEPVEAYSAARFVSDATRLIHDIHQRGKLPLLVGGTMLYVKAMRDGLHDLPASDSAVRAEVAGEAELRGWPAMHQHLASFDPATAARLKPGDSQRIGRAIELYRQSGRIMSDWIASPREELHSNSGAPVIDSAILSLEPGDRSVLHARIAHRFQNMLRQGFLDEMKRLRERGDLHPEMSSMRCVGYRQAWEWLDLPEGERPPLQDLIDKGVAATRQLAKRQLTWLRAMPDRHVLDCLSPDLQQQAFALVKAFLNA